LGDPTKARTVLGWEPKVTFDELVRIMVEHDLAQARREKAAATHEEAPALIKTRWGAA
jgi:GDPmannose 4,6-dehydratase